MHTPGSIVRRSRQAARLTQAQLAERLGTTQSAIARLEADGSNPRVDTLARAVAACGYDLSVQARPRNSSIDETLVARQLRMPPAQRLKSFDRAYADARKIALAGQRARGELD